MYTAYRIYFNTPFEYIHIITLYKTCIPLFYIKYIHYVYTLHKDADEDILWTNHNKY